MLCQVFPERYSSQLSEKVSRFQELVPNYRSFSVFESDVSYYRARVEFRVWHDGNETNYIMFDPETKAKVKIEHCPMAIASIASLMPKLMIEIVQTPEVRHKLFQVDFLATLSGEMLVTLIYRCSLKGGKAWLTAAKNLKRVLPISHIIGRARKEKVVLDQDYVVERFTVDGKVFIYQQVENSFTQPNAKVAQKMLHWVQKVAETPEEIKGDLLELYCGNGYFSIGLSEYYHQILATEISKTSVQSSQFNIEVNQVKNLTVVRMAATEISAALEGQKFNRLKEVDLTAYNFQTILVDPPRSGLDDLTRQMVKRFTRIIYISCNPETLARDLVEIEKTHEIIESALFDQFPYTHHIEAGVFLKKIEP